MRTVIPTSLFQWSLIILKVIHSVNSYKYKHTLTLIDIFPELSDGKDEVPVSSVESLGKRHRSANNKQPLTEPPQKDNKKAASISRVRAYNKLEIKKKPLQMKDKDDDVATEVDEDAVTSDSGDDCP